MVTATRSRRRRKITAAHSGKRRVCKSDRERRMTLVDLCLDRKRARIQFTSHLGLRQRWSHLAPFSQRCSGS